MCYDVKANPFPVFNLRVCIPDTAIIASMSALMSAVPATQEEGRITQLPGELLTDIFGYLSTHDLIHCLQVCKSWAFKALACEPLWRQLAITAFADQYILFQVAPLVRHLLVIVQTRGALWQVTRILSTPETTSLVGLRRIALFIHQGMDQAAAHALSRALETMGNRLEAVEIGYFDSAGSATLEDLVFAPCPRVTQVAYSIYSDESFTATRQWDQMLATARMLTDLRIQTDARMTADQIRLVLLAAPRLTCLSLNVCEYETLAVIADHSFLVNLDFNYYDHSTKAYTTWYQRQQTSPHLSSSANSSSNRGLRVVHLGWVVPNSIDLIVSMLIRNRTTLEDLAIKERLGNRNGRFSSAWNQLLPGPGQLPTPEPFFPRLATATLSVSWDTQVLTAMLSRCPVLSSLSMMHMCTVQGPPLFKTLAAIPCLDHLAIDTCTSITSGLEDYLRLQPRLRSIAFYGEIPALTDGALDALGSLTNLRCLELGQMESTVRLDAWVASVGTLEALWLSSMMSVDDDILLRLKNHVRKLYLDMLLSITDHGLALFVDQATTTEELHISLCPAISKGADWVTTSKIHIFLKE